MSQNIGIDVKTPEKSCQDANCPFHASLKVRGQIIEGRVIKDKMHGSVVVQKDFYHYLKKYERYEKRSTKITAHNPPCLNIEEGDTVRIMECRPISKGKSFVVIEKKEA